MILVEHRWGKLGYAVAYSASVAAWGLSVVVALRSRRAVDTACGQWHLSMLRGLRARQEGIRNPLWVPTKSGQRATPRPGPGARA
jgi:hypothetical protein